MEEKDIVDCGRDCIFVGCSSDEDVKRFDSLANRAWFAVNGEGVEAVVARGNGLVLLVWLKLSNVERFSGYGEGWGVVPCGLLMR